MDPHFCESMPCGEAKPSPKASGELGAGGLPPGSQNGWYISRSASRIEEAVGGIRWSPVRKPTTIHNYFEPVPFSPGTVVVCSLVWESDGMKGSNEDFDGSCCDPTGQGMGISDRYLRCLAGTGDFRIGLFQSDTRVGNGTYEGDEEGATKDFNRYRGFQVRIHPHLSRGFENLGGRLYEHKADGSKEPHNNISLWTRVREGTQGLQSDQAQKVDHSGFTKKGGNGSQPQPWGANMPFGRPQHLTIRAERLDDCCFQVSLTVNEGGEDERRSPVLHGKFESTFRPDLLDCLAITYTNQSRRYDYVMLTDLEVVSHEAGATPGARVAGEGEGKLL